MMTRPSPKAPSASVHALNAMVALRMQRPADLRALADQLERDAPETPARAALLDMLRGFAMMGEQRITSPTQIVAQLLSGIR